MSIPNYWCMVNKSKTTILKTMQLFKRRKGRPARLYLDEVVSENPETFERQKSLITPRPYDFNKITSYLTDHYDLEERKLYPVQVEMFEANLQRLDYYNQEHFSPVFLTVVRNERSRRLYADCSENEEIFLYIEKSSGYIETNSCELHNKLIELRGVTQEEYDRNSQKLYELIGVMFHNMEE